MRSPHYSVHKHMGIIGDLPPEEAPPSAWTGGNNIQFQDTASTRSGGYEKFADPISGLNPIFALSVIVGPNAYWIYCSYDSVHVTDGQNHWDITPTGLLPCELGDWTATILNGVPVMNNTISPPFYWDLNTSNKCQTIPGWPAGATCKVIRSFKYHLFALNIFDGLNSQPNTLWWSESAAPGAIPQEWTPTASNDAGDMTLADTPSGIIDGLPLRDTFVVYKDYSTYVLSYVAGQYIYTQRKLFLTSGLQSANCVAEINGEHWCFTGTDLIRHDGQNFSSVVQNKVKHAIIDSIEPAKLKAVCLTSRHRNQQIWLCIPTQGNQWLNRAWVINTLTNDAGVRDLPDGCAFVARGVVNPGTDANVAWAGDDASWETDITFWDQQNYSPTEDSILMCGGSQSVLWSADTTDEADGQPISAYMERLSLPINDNILHGMVTRVIPRLRGKTGEVVNISIGTQDFFEQPIRWSQPVPFVIGSSVACSFQAEGRLFSIRFEADTLRRWTVYSYKIEAVDLGLY